MKVDRERYLVFVATLTAACGSSAPVVTAEPGPAPTHDLPPPVFTPPLATIAPPPPAATSATPEPPPVLPPAANNKSPNPYNGDPVSGQACDPALNKIGTPPTCSISAPPGPTCESISDTKKECPTMSSLLKPRVAQAAIECLRRKSGTRDICEFNVSSICAYEALGSACIEPSAKTACNDVMKRCGVGPRDHYNKMSRDACEAGVSAIVDSKRKKFISCISESCRFETCLTYL